LQAAAFLQDAAPARKKDYSSVKEHLYGGARGINGYRSFMFILGLAVAIEKDFLKSCDYQTQQN